MRIEHLFTTFENRHPGRFLAAEETLLSRAADGFPSLLLGSSTHPCLILGYGQDAGEIDLERCREARIAVLRRLTGGTAVYHEGDILCSLALPGSHPAARTIPASYDLFLTVLSQWLGTLGITTTRHEEERKSCPPSPLCFLDHRSETLLYEGKKAVGCAQARRERAVLVHGAILLHLDADRIAPLFHIDPGVIRSAMTPLPLSIEGKRGPADSLADTFAGRLGLERKDEAILPIDPEAAARYTTPHWAPVIIEP